MPVSLHARIPGPDIAQRILFSTSESSDSSDLSGLKTAAAKIFPGGSFRSEVAVARRLAYLDRRPFSIKPQELLRQENAFAPLTPQQKLHLDAAGSANALFILTGQQPGLFGGPMLWLYKALTCAALAKEWSVKLSRPVIPIFWVAGDDADLEECNHVELLDARAAEVSGPLSLSFPDAANLIPMGERQLNTNDVAALLTRLSAIWNPETIDVLRQCYSVPGTLTAAFLRLAQSQLGKEGILFVDGYSKNLRALARPVLEHAAKNWVTFQNTLYQSTEVAEAAGIQTQVPLRAGLVHAFTLQHGERHRLYAEKSAGGLDRIYRPEHPSKNLLEKFSELDLTHDVFTRPLVADAIFPVLGHVLGPAELRYFAQLSNTFLATTGDMPLLHPRMSVTIAPSRAKEDFQLEGLEISEMVRLGPRGLRTYLEQRTWQSHTAFSALAPVPVEGWIEDVRRLHALHFPDLGPMNGLEKSLESAWKRYIRSLKRMAFSAHEKKSQPLFNHLQWLGGGLGQDRHLNFPSLFNALGKSGFSELREVLDPSQPDLQFILFSEEGV